MESKNKYGLSRVEAIEKVLVEKFRCSIFKANSVANEILDILDNTDFGKAE